MRLQCQRPNTQGRAVLHARPTQDTRSGRPHARSVQCLAAPSAQKKKTEFTNDLRKAAIALHTREQLGTSKKGATGDSKNGAEKPARPEPVLEGYLRFLQESKIVFEFYEKTIAETSDAQLKLFQNTGLERSAALEKDLKWFQNDMELLPDLATGPGSEYVKYLSKLADEDVPAFLCHYYNTYFAHMSGGAMIGKSVSNKLLDGHELEFYKYATEGDPKESLGAVVKDNINKVAETWDPETRQRSIDETKQTFHYSGTILKCIFNA